MLQNLSTNASLIEFLALALQSFLEHLAHRGLNTAHIRDTAKTLTSSSFTKVNNLNR